jgi:uncharacterized membrane protein
LDFPGAANGSWAEGINNQGLIIGGYIDGNYNSNGYVYSNSNGTFATLDYPGALSTVLFGINDAGLITGEYTSDPSYEVWYSFLYKPSQFTSFAVSNDGAVEGINGVGILVGGYGPWIIDPNGGSSDGGGFWYDAENGAPNPNNFTLIDDPGYPGTTMDSVNNNGQMSGEFLTPNGGEWALLYSGGAFTNNLSPPGSSESGGYSLNDDVQIVGLNSDSQGTHGLVLIPPH